MDFDFKHVGVPFRMSPGLARLPPGARHLTPLDVTSTRYQEKLAVSRSGGAMHCVTGFDPADALRAIAGSAAAGTTPGSPGPPGHPATPELAFEEDLVVLDAATASVPWMCVCTPSGWAPEEKLGLGLPAIHTPVADIGHLAAAWPHLMALATNGEHWERFVWTVSPSPHYDQHPRRRPRAPWPSDPDPAAFARQCYFRAERQTFLPVHDAQGAVRRQAVFTIRVMVEPLPAVVATPAEAQRLHDALASMTASVLAYKNLQSARERLLAWLSRMAAGPGDDQHFPV